MGESVLQFLKKKFLILWGFFNINFQYFAMLYSEAVVFAQIKKFVSKKRKDKFPLESLTNSVAEKNPNAK